MEANWRNKGPKQPRLRALGFRLDALVLNQGGTIPWSSSCAGDEDWRSLLLRAFGQEMPSTPE